jgi:glycine/D-amino acid oxidase-like deaminating enzyme
MTEPAPTRSGGDGQDQVESWWATGLPGAAAALSAHDAGAQVLVVEKCPQPGGNSLVSSANTVYHKRPLTRSASLRKITDGFSAAMRRFTHNQQIPWVDFVKGQRKDEVMHQHLVGFDREEGALFIGRAQEKTALFHTERRRDANGDSYPWIVKTTGVVNHFYVYAVTPSSVHFF